MTTAEGQVQRGADELLIWTPEGVWFQYHHPERGIVSSYLGRISLTSIELYARDHDLPYEVFDAMLSRRPVGTDTGRGGPGRG